jgi:hypothetical protein
MATRTTVYIDGFNFYHGLKDAIYKLEDRWLRYYWLDFVKFAEQLLDEGDELISVKYFTAQPLEDHKKKRQSALFKANKFLHGDRVQIVNGKYYKKRVKCKGSCKEFFKLHEEKRTDVNISVHMMGDCAFNKTDKIILISADSDLMPPLEHISEYYKHIKLEVFFPPCRQSSDIKDFLSDCESLTSHRPKFEKAVMPHNVTVGKKSVDIPEEWIHGTS